MTLSTWKQTESMRRAWPMFKVLHRTRQVVAWEGLLLPLSQSYTVQVCLRRIQDCWRSDPSQILVVVTDPLLHQRAEDSADPIPHHYPNSANPKLPFLCLYDPDAREWHPGLSVAKTIVPWTIDWLACYEGWLATGKWTGGGRHG